MNNWLLFFILIALFVLFYYSHNRKIGPSNILVLTFMFPLVIVLFLDSYFSYEIGLETIIILSSVLLTFHFCELLPVLFKSKIRKNNYYQDEGQYVVFVKPTWLILAYIIVFINLVFKYQYIMAVGAQYGASNLISSLAAARIMLIDYQNTGDAVVRLPFYSIIITMISGWINILCMHLFLYKKVVQKEMDWKLFGIVAIFILSLIFTTGRAAFFPVAIHVIYLLILFSNISDRIIYNLRKKAVKVFSVVTVAFLLFVVMGSLRSSGEDEDEEVRMPISFVVATYAGAPIIGLDVYVKKGMQQAYYFGEHTFREFYDYARILGVPYKRSQFHKDDFYAGKGSSNVYTGLYYWISDFTLWGSLAYAALLGLIFGTFYSSKPRFENVAECYLRSYFYYALLLMFYDDQFNTIWSINLFVTLLVVNYFKNKFIVYTNQYHFLFKI